VAGWFHQRQDVTWRLPLAAAAVTARAAGLTGIHKNW